MVSFYVTTFEMKTLRFMGYVSEEKLYKIMSHWELRKSIPIQLTSDDGQTVIVNLDPDKILSLEVRRGTK